MPDSNIQHEIDHAAQVLGLLGESLSHSLKTMPMEPDVKLGTSANHSGEPSRGLGMQ